MMLKIINEIPHPEQLSPLVLAYVGDAVYELMVREYLITQGLCNVNQLHRHAVQYVRASTQAIILRALEGQLSPAEQAVARRGRNAKSGHGARGDDIIAYRHSTGLECLVGYLYLKRDTDRLKEILQLARQVVEQKICGEKK